MTKQHNDAVDLGGLLFDAPVLAKGFEEREGQFAEALVGSDDCKGSRWTGGRGNH